MGAQPRLPPRANGAILAGTMLAFRARFVFPIDGPPLRDSVVAIDHDRIVAVGESSSPAVRDLLSTARDLGDVAILPGLINPHTHLEFSNLRVPLGTPGMAFPDWIRLVVERRRQADAKYLARESLIERIDHGASESSVFGTTALGDIGWSPLHAIRLATAKLDLTQFREYIGLRKAVSDIAIKTILPIGSLVSETYRVGLSPHAPYSVHSQLVQACVAWSSPRRMPIAYHLAESREELQLLRFGTGPFVRLLDELDAWEPNAIPFGSRPLDYLQMLAKSHRALVIHGNYLDDEEIGFLGGACGQHVGGLLSADACVFSARSVSAGQDAGGGRECGDRHRQPGVEPRSFGPGRHAIRGEATSDRAAGNAAANDHGQRCKSAGP